MRFTAYLKYTGRWAGILINTFGLARDPHLVQFVQKVPEIARGMACFTSTMTLGQYIMMDLMDVEGDAEEAPLRHGAIAVPHHRDAPVEELRALGVRQPTEIRLT
jgi:hypothetical protein